MQAEECSHGRLKCNYFCCTCKVGGTHAEKNTDKGYTDIFQVLLKTSHLHNRLTMFVQCGELHAPKDTRTQIKHQIQLSILSGGTEKVRSAVSQSGIKDAATAAIIDQLLELGKVLRKRTAGKPAVPQADITAHLENELDVLLRGKSIDDHINPLLGIQGLDIHKDTPTEILHTILLGVIKYFWGQTVFILDKAHFLETFQTHLESINKDGLNSPMLSANYIVRYKGGLVGKHFKSLTQVMPYVIYNLVPETVLNGWLVIGRLVVLLWHTVIEDTECYLISIFSLSMLLCNLFVPHHRPSCRVSLMIFLPSAHNVHQASWYQKQSSIFFSTFPCSLDDSALPFFFQLNVINRSTMFFVWHRSIATAKR